MRTTDRDLWILETIAKLRFATTGQLAALHFEGSRWSANKRLRKLLDAGLVRTWVRDLSKENVYSLDRVGARILVRDGEEPPVPRGLDGNLDHLLAINGFRVLLSLFLSETGGEITWWRSDWELRAQARERVIPDALLAIQKGGEAQTFALEIDNRTRSARGFLRKILAYRGLIARGRGIYGMSHFLTLVVGRDERWLERYRLAVDHGDLGRGIWFVSQAAIEEQGLVGPVWKSAHATGRYSLRDLISLPYGKEGNEHETPHVSQA